MEYSVYSTSDPQIVGVLVPLVFLTIILYCITLYKFASKAGYGDIAFLAFIPIGSFYLQLRMAKMNPKRIWWFLGFIVPFFNFVAWFAIAITTFQVLIRMYSENSTGSTGSYFFLNLLCLGWIANIMAMKQIRRPGDNRNWSEPTAGEVPKTQTEETGVVDTVKEIQPEQVQPEQAEDIEAEIAKCELKYKEVAALDLNKFTAGEKGYLNNLIILCNSSLKEKNLKQAKNYLRQIDKKLEQIKTSQEK